MASRRTLKAASAIREVVAMSLLTDLKDPRVDQVTITSVEVAGDMRSAKVRFTVYGSDPVKEKLALAGFRSAAGFLQQKCAKRIEARYTPRLTFEIDEGVKNLVRVTEILERERRLREAENPQDADGDETDAQYGEDAENGVDELDDPNASDDGNGNGEEARETEDAPDEGFGA